MASNYGNFGYSNSIFTGDIDKDGTIYSVGTGRERIRVGIDTQREQELLQAINEMQETLDNWRPKMIEHGYIQIPKTAEEIAREATSEQFRAMQEQARQQAEINQALLQAISGLQNQLGELKSNVNIGNDDKWINEQGDKQRGSTLEDNEKIARASNGCVKPSKKINTSSNKK